MCRPSDSRLRNRSRFHADKRSLAVWRALHSGSWQQANGGVRLHEGRAGATHALHMRFNSRKQALAFREHPLVGEAFTDVIEPCTENVAEVLLEARAAPSPSFALGASELAMVRP